MATLAEEYALTHKRGKPSYGNTSEFVSGLRPRPRCSSGPNLKSDQSVSLGQTPSSRGTNTQSPSHILAVTLILVDEQVGNKTPDVPLMQ